MREILFRGKRVNDGKWVESCCPLGEMHSGVVTWDFVQNTVCQYTGLTDISGRKVFEGDIIESHMPDGRILDLNMVIRYGTYRAYCPADREYTDNVGFYVSAPGYPDMPLGTLGDYAKVTGNIFDNPELAKAAGNIPDNPELAEEPEREGHGNGWIPCSERFPENEEEVEITFTGRNCRTGETLYLTARAFYEDGTLTTEESFCYWEETEGWDYDEEKDSCIIPEGWFEYVSFGEKFSKIDSPVIAWRHVIPPYQPPT